MNLSILHCIFSSYFLEKIQYKRIEKILNISKNTGRKYLIFNKILVKNGNCIPVS